MRRRTAVALTDRLAVLDSLRRYHERCDPTYELLAARNHTEGNDHMAELCHNVAAASRRCLNEIDLEVAKIWNRIERHHGPWWKRPW